MSKSHNRLLVSKQELRPNLTSHHSMIMLEIIKEAEKLAL